MRRILALAAVLVLAPFSAHAQRAIDLPMGAAAPDMADFIFLW